NCPKEGTPMRKAICVLGTATWILLCCCAGASGQGTVTDGKRLFESETFGGNGRTCRTWHGKTTGRISPNEIQQLFKTQPNDPLSLADGSDDGNGAGTTRVRTHATILVRIPLALNIKLAADPTATHVTLKRGIPTVVNTPAVDPVLMLDGRQPDLPSQALDAIQDHAQPAFLPTAADLEAIKEFE